MRIAFVVGHNSKSQGAMSYQGESEYLFNLKVGSKLKNVFVKDDDYLDELKGFDLIIELHFNAFKGDAFGAESLVRSHDENAASISEFLLEHFCNHFKIRNRGVKYISKRMRGYKNLLQYGDTPSLIFEPCFADRRTPESVQIIEKWRWYAQFLNDFASSQEDININIWRELIPPKKRNDYVTRD